MSMGETLYLVLVISMFVSFGLLLAALSWLDSREERTVRLRTRGRAGAAQRRAKSTQPMLHSGAASR